MMKGFIVNIVAYYKIPLRNFNTPIFKVVMNICVLLSLLWLVVVGTAKALPQSTYYGYKLAHAWMLGAILAHTVYISFVSTYFSSLSTPAINNERFPTSPRDH